MGGINMERRHKVLAARAICQHAWQSKFIEHGDHECRCRGFAGHTTPHRCQCSSTTVSKPRPKK